MLSPSMGHAANTCSKLFEIKKIAVNEMISQYQARYAIGKTMIDIWRQSHSQRRAVLFAARTKVAYSYQIDVPIIQQHGLESEFQYIATELFHFKKYLETGELRLVDGSKDSMRDAYR
ncbi:MAG: hypothetical protein H7235_07485, partial [Bdellovibrionaceae bacterium]|nr:hypothetical protein [Pseudobdellovibrionaceae bacterium]